MGLIDVIAGKMDVIVNCTPLTASGESPMPQSTILPKHVVMDMVYSPFKTRLLKEAAMRGARTIEGVHMLAHQATLSFELWTGKRVRPELMLKAGMKVLLGG
jgi:shikimate dehydrogenase